MKLNLGQWGPKTKVAVPGSDKFNFMHDLERNLKERFRDLNDCALGFTNDKELHRWQALTWRQLHFVEHFDKDPDARLALERLGCRIDDGGFIRYRHYFVCYIPKWVVEGRAELRQTQRQKLIHEQVAEKADDMSRALGAEIEASVEVSQEKIEFVPQEELKRGPGRSRKEI